MAGRSIPRALRHPEWAWTLVRYLAGREAQGYQLEIWPDLAPSVDAFGGLVFWEPRTPPANREAALEWIELG